MTRLVAFDGDHTLWTPLDILCLSDRTPTDTEGNPDYTFAPTDEPYVVQRADGARFRLRPEVREVLLALRSAGVPAGVVSYNHEGNVRRILDAFGILPLFDYVVGEWHTNKDAMIERLRAEAERDGISIGPDEVLLVDDDPQGLYVEQCTRLGYGFRKFGVDIEDLREVLPLVGIPREEASWRA